MIDLDEARQRVLAACRPLPAVRWPLAAADGCVTAESVVSHVAVPAFANSAMDGFAVRTGDVPLPDGPPVVLRVVGEVLAGRVPARAVASGECMKIMTGAPMPEGADAVVPVERSAFADGRGGARVEVSGGASPGQYVRPAGDDVQPGDEVVAAGAELVPARLGALASIGEWTVRVHPRPRVGVFTTGDELVGGPWPLAPGQIYDANHVALLSTLARGGFEAVDLGCVADDERALRAAIEAGVRDCDALVTTGGVSMGDVDLVRVVLEQLGPLDRMQVAIRPAKPFALGIVEQGERRVPVLGLPGNPVSALVSFELLARPGLRRLAGQPPERLVRPTQRAIAGEPLARQPDGKVHFARVLVERRDGQLVLRMAGGQGSHQLVALAAADGLAVLADGPGVEAGEPVEVLLFEQ